MTGRSVTYRFIGRQKSFRETIVSAVAKTLCRVTLDNLRGIIYEWEIFLRTTNRNFRLSPRSSRLRKSDIFNRVREPGSIDRRRRFNSRDLCVRSIYNAPKGEYFLGRGDLNVTTWRLRRYVEIRRAEIFQHMERFTATRFISRG